MIIKLISFLIIWSWKCGNMLRNKITSLQTLVNRVCSTVLNIFPSLISKPHIRKHKNHSKASSDMGDLLEISVYTRSHDTTYRIVNQEDTIEVTLSGVITHNTNPPQPTFHVMVWRLKGGRTGKLKLHLLVDRIECFMLLIFVKIFLFVDLQEWNRLFYLSMNQTYVMIIYSWIQDTVIVSVIVFSIKLIWISIC